MTGREIHLVARPAGAPLERDFALVEAEVPEPAAGQMLVRNTWMSLDPAQRVRMHAGASGYLPALYTRAEFQAACKRYVRAFGQLRATSQYQPPPGIHWVRCG